VPRGKKTPKKLTPTPVMQRRSYPVTLDHPAGSLDCALCGWNYPDLQKGTNTYHTECYEDLSREFHKPPERLVEMNRSKVP
jgi:hypothetical protein